MGEYDDVFKEIEEAEQGDGIQFYRCMLCGGVVTPWDLLKTYGCPKCKGSRVRKSELSFWEKIVQIIKHPSILKGGNHAG